MERQQMRIVNKLSGIAEEFVESNLAAAVGVLTLAAVLWESFK
jgi:hypothetical protein